MPQALSCAYLHLVFSAKDRRPYFADPDLRLRLHEYLGGISKTLDCHPVRIGGVQGHVHILARFSRTITQADWIKELKRVSSLWLKEQCQEQSLNRANLSDLRNFAWQGGYATFSVSSSYLDQVTNYIANQEEHHSKMSFQDELRTLLTKHGMPFDESYLWD